jgi:trimethylamine:corrinoid methyltransferase-like protein
MRDEIWEPRAFDHDDFSAWDKAGRVSVVERAAAKAREILAAHRTDPLPPGIADALRDASL